MRFSWLPAFIFVVPAATFADEIPHAPGCDIKGNVGKNKNLFYVPSHPTYEKVQISKRGEAWFCTEAEALAAGFKPAGSKEGRFDKSGLAQQACQPAVEAPDNCAIKGNISSKGDRIYHVPCSKFYTKTEIRIEDGERWFCSEQEAVANGWRPPRF